MHKIPALAFLLALATTASAQYACSDYKRAASAAVPNLDHSALSDTFDIIHTHLDLDLTALPTNSINGHATLNVDMLQASSVFRFELDGYSIDSAKVNQTSVAATSTGNFRILGPLPSGWNPGGSATVEIWYSGSGPADPSGWGGWHHSSPYFFNLGVGFGVNPHSYGRSLFPAFDNFTEHSTYSFDILTRGNYKAYANGLRTQLTGTGGDTILQSWNCTDPISAYLVSLAVSDYEEIWDTLTSSTGTRIPSVLLARSGDTSDVRSSFRHLSSIFDSFERHFGPYIWDKVGYAMTTVGAMEHATSIHLPGRLADGTLNGESIIAHELAHHWWGNLITCAKAEDMWINEGMAEYSSHLYLEDVYDRERYIDAVRTNQLQVLNYAHAQDGGYIALTGVDHGTTYGMHVYNKGAWVGHNLRGFFRNDIQYRQVMTDIFNDSAHTNLTSAQFESALNNRTFINFSNFFTDWIYTPGHVAITVDSLYSTQSGGTWTVTCKYTQHRRMRSTFLTEAPMEVRLYAADGEVFSAPVTIVSGQVTIGNVANVPFQPVYATINEGDSFITGTTFDRIKGIGQRIYNMDASKARLTVNSSTDSHFVYLEHHWAGPDDGTTIARLSDSRFWSLKGNWGSDFDADIRIFYDGRSSSGNLDTDLVSNTEDSLVVLYRPNGYSDWQLYPDFTVNTLGSVTDGFGQINILNVQAGDYVLANAPDDLGVEEHGRRPDHLKVYPNPNSGEIIIEQFSSDEESTSVQVINAQGKIVYSEQWELEHGWNKNSIVLYHPNGAYVVKTSAGEQKILLTR